MATAAMERGLVIEAPNKKGMLEKISSAISSKGLNIRGICACGEGKKATFMMVTSNNPRAIDALKSLRLKIKEEKIVQLVLQDKVGALQKVSKKLAGQGINLKYIYGTIGGSQKVCLLVFSSNNNEKAVKILRNYNF